MILHFNELEQVFISTSYSDTWCIQFYGYRQMAVKKSVCLLRCKILADSLSLDFYVSTVKWLQESESWGIWVWGQPSQTENHMLPSTLFWGFSNIFFLLEWMKVLILYPFVVRCFLKSSLNICYTQSFISLTSQWFIQQIVNEHPLSARRCARQPENNR